MPLPGWLARFNRRVTNRVAQPLAGRLPGFAVVIHRGRISGRSYETPVNLFRSADGYVIALTYGRHRDWVRNVVAAGACAVRTRSTVTHLVDPRIVVAPPSEMVPPVVRTLLRLADVTEFLSLRRPAT